MTELDIAAGVHPDGGMDIGRPYAAAADLYWAAGWRGILPLPRDQKDPPPVTVIGDEKISWTGAKAAAYPSYPDVTAWLEDPKNARGNIALRAPVDVVFLDVDAYGKKRGDLALKALIAELGPLPATWRSTSRGDGPMSGALGEGLYPSGQYPFRVPAGSYFRGEADKAIDIIQSTHRYTVVWPSRNPHNELRPYRWWRPDGTLAPHGEVPRVDELPELPAAWLAYLLNPTPQAAKATLDPDGGSAAWLGKLRYGPACGRAVNTLQKFERSIKAGGPLHNIARDATRALIMLGAEGHRLGSTAVETHGKGSPVDLIYTLMATFVEAACRPRTGSAQRSKDSAEAEFLRLVDGAVELAAARHPKPRSMDPECIEFVDEWPEWCGPISVPGGIGAVPDGLASREANRGPSDTAHAERTAQIDHWGTWTPDPDEDPLSHAVRSRDKREPLNVTSVALAAEWTLESMGRGALSGVFYRGEGHAIVYTPAVGENGYRAAHGEADDDGPAQVVPLDPQILAAMVQYSFACFKEREPKKVPELADMTDELAPETRTVTLPDGRKVIRSPAMFPVEAARTALAVPTLLKHVRRLAGVVHVPTVRVDGSLLDEPGYDPSSQLLYLPEPGLTVPRVPERPSAAEVASARALLDEMVQDFPFVTEHDKASYYGLLLTPLLRVLTPPSYKMFAVSAHQAGSGKTLLANLARHIHGGVFRAELPEDEPELRKAITSILDTTTGPIVNFDNVTGLVRSPTMAGLLTSPVWDDRILGKNTLARCINDRVWVLTGNNMALGGDLRRRAIDVNIDPGCPAPELRTGFAIEDIEDWVRLHRGEILGALLTLVRAWVAAGRPAERASSDSYGRWLSVVNGVLHNAGVPGLCDAAEARKRTEGSEDAEWGVFLEAIHDVFGDGEWTAKQVLAKVDTSQFGDMHNGPIPVDKLPERLAEKLARSAGGPASLGRSLGRWLTNHEGRWAGLRTVRNVREERTGIIWRIDHRLPKTDTQDTLI